MSKFSKRFFFERELPVILAWILFVVLILYILFDVWAQTCVAIRVREDVTLFEIVLIVLKKTVHAIASDGGRNLGLLLAASIGWYFVARRTNIAEREVNISEQNLNDHINLARQQFLSENSFARQEGIRKLEEIALSHEKECKKVIRILSYGIRELANREDIKNLHKQNRRSISDVEIAFEALANIAEPFEREKKKLINLSGIDLTGLRLSKIDLSYFPFKDLVLIGAKFSKINFASTDFDQSSIDNVTFKEYKNLTKEQIMEAYWEEGKRPQGLPEKWDLPSTTDVF